MDPEKNIQEENIDNVSETKIEKNHGGIGPIIGSIVVIILIVLGGLYYWGSTVKDVPEAKAPVVENQENLDQDIVEIEAELNTDELDNLDQELDAIEAEIDAELENL